MAICLRLIAVKLTYWSSDKDISSQPVLHLSVTLDVYYL